MENYSQTSAEAFMEPKLWFSSNRGYRLIGLVARWVEHRLATEKCSTSTYESSASLSGLRGKWRALSSLLQAVLEPLQLSSMVRFGRLWLCYAESPAHILERRAEKCSSINLMHRPLRCNICLSHATVGPCTCRFCDLQRHAQSLAYHPRM